MKRKIFGLCIAMLALVIGGCANPVTDNPADTTPTTGYSVITLLAIPGVTAPVMGATPVTTGIDTAQYSGTITWSERPAIFLANTAYTVQITLSPKSGWTLTGVAANSFTVAGATSVTHEKNSGTVTAVFPATGATPVATLDGTTLSQAYMAYYGTVTTLMNATTTLDPATNEYIAQNADGSAKVRSAMNLSSPMLMVGAYTFTDYYDSTSGYTVNGTLSYVMTTDAASNASFYYNGDFAYTGGPVTGLSLDYSISGATMTGTMTVGGIVYDIATMAVRSTPAVATPTFSVDSGMYSTDITVILSCATDGAEIYYTLDGSTPTSGSYRFTVAPPLTLNATQAIRAIAIKAGMPSSVVSMGGYVFASVAPVLPLSTIDFADAAPSKRIDSGTYTNAVSGIGDGAVTYSSDTISTATVNASTGEVTLVAPGTTVITANKASTATHSAASNSYTLTVTKIPSTIEFSDSAPSRRIDSGSYTNGVSGDGTGAITYSSGTPSTASVDSSTGLVTLIAAGTTVITANKAATTTHSAGSNSYTLTVTLIPSTIVFEDDAPTKRIDGGTYINAISGIGDGKVTYNDDNLWYTVVDPDSGLVTLELAYGTTIITVNKAATTTHAAVSNSYTLTVTLIPSTIVFTDTNPSRMIGTGPYTNTVSGVGDGPITYTSSNIYGALVNANTGEITMKYSTTVVITANKLANGWYSAASNSYSLTITDLQLSDGTKIGDVYQGGKLAYILKYGDPGYIAGEQHGIISALTDLSTGIAWANGAFVETSVTTNTVIGSGQANTAAIVAQNGSGSTYAAGLCDNYTNTETGTGVYSDWYLPSYDELGQVVFIARSESFGGFLGTDYWSSSQGGNSVGSWCVEFAGGSTQRRKYTNCAVHPVRSF